MISYQSLLQRYSNFDSYSFQLSGKETLAELWILGRISNCAKQVNVLLEDMSFMAAASTVYNFWLYELCDIYIEVTKSLLESKDPLLVRSAKDTLYTCLDQGLKMLHPMMPYVTEELYHVFNFLIMSSEFLDDHLIQRSAFRSPSFQFMYLPLIFNL
jgi:valyl-tRNA synthetase